MDEDFGSIPSFMKELVVNKPDQPLIPDVTTIKPEPGFCLKTKNVEGSKVFLNFCHSSALPPPQDIDDDELSEIIRKSENEDTVNYRVPISLGEARDSVDKSGNPCTTHDVVINSDFYQKVEKSLLFKNFVIHVALEGLEDKCRTEFIKKDWIILKNKKYMGTLEDVTVRTSAKKPLITEISSTSAEKSEQNLVKEIQGTRIKFEEFPAPEYEIIQDPPEGYPTHLVAEFRMPLVLKAKEIELDLGEDRILLCAPNKYFLDIFLPYLINQEESGAQFNADSSVLTLTMTVLPVE